jgi:hypothetical protein
LIEIIAIFPMGRVIASAKIGPGLVFGDYESRPGIVATVPAADGIDIVGSADAVFGSDRTWTLQQVMSKIPGGARHTRRRERGSPAGLLRPRIGASHRRQDRSAMRATARTSYISELQRLNATSS